MLKKLGMVVFLLPTLFFTQAQANDYCCGSQWEVYGDWLYWKPRSDTLDYATPILPASIGEVSNVDPSYQSGFRVGVYYQCNSVFYDVFYARFHHNYANSTAAAPGTSIFPTRSTGQAALAISADWSFDYDSVDVLVGFNIGNGCSCFDPYLFGGLKFVRIDQTFSTHVTTVTTTTSVVQENNIDGYGVDFGLGFDYDFWSCLGFFSRVSADVFLAQFDRSIDTTTLPANVHTHFDDNYWNVVSALNVMFGLQYDYRFDGCWCGNLGIAVGYEFHRYVGLSAWLNTLINGNGIRRDLDNLSLDGLFVRVSVGF